MFALNGMIKDSVRAKLVVPIPCLVLLSPAQHQILHAFSRLEESHGFLYLRPEIVEIPHSASAADLLTARNLLLPIGRGVGMHMNLFDLNRAVLSVDKVMLGCDIDAPADVTPVKTTQALKALQEKAGKRQTYALDIPDRSTVKQAIELGYAEVGGPGLQNPLNKRPDHTTPLPLEELLSDTVDQ